MFQRRLFLVLLRPSLYSTVATIFLCAIFFSFIGWVYITQATQAYEYFFGDSGMKYGMDQASQMLAQEAPTDSGLALTYNILIVVGSLLLGGAVYFALQTLGRIMFTVSATIEEVQGGDQSARNAVRREVAQRLALRIVIALVWIAYFYLTLNITLPYCVSVFGEGMARLPYIEGIFFIIVAGVIFFAITHIHLIFIRLLVLRPRVFGGDDVITSAIEGY